ncbi:MAG: NAD(P)/FAD-dependent oxidoreductase [Atopobiaceae bacterium]|nr:NAD(P)/FAD-dependent oxidoreductase [Atopobiaceae bacterium]MBQ6522424.1 NAD(P)/FAD-dependent oxidoreductase [Atopobiaceae bacterium]
MRRYVIIGGGIAGINCIEGIRSVDADGPITLVSAEEDSNYGRPLISYYLEGKTSPQRMSYRGEDFYARMGVTALHGVSAEKIDAKARKIALSNGGKLPYDELCVAAGSSPFVPPMEGLDTVPARFSFMTLADARALEQAVFPETRVLIVGGGLIGLKCAEGLHAITERLTVCDLAPHVLSSILTPDASELVEQHLESLGIALMLGDSAARFDGTRAYMRSGAEVEFDVLVLAIGVRPNVSLVKDAGGETGRGIVVDARMATTLPHVFAAGDCVESANLVTGQRGPIAILPNAAQQGRTAGINMACGEAEADGSVPMNSMGLFGLHIMTAGSYPGEDAGGQVFSAIGDGTYKKLFMKDGRLVGFILMGDVHRAGIYTALIREQRPLDSIDYEAIFQDPSLIPFGRAYRKQKLGGVVR